MQPAKPGPRRPNWPDKVAHVSTSTKRAVAVGFAVIALAFGGFGIWSTTVPIAGAVVANGQVVVASKRRQVQHPTGGVIRALHVEDGTVVSKGEILLELEDADAMERYARTRDSLFLALASEVRLQAEALNRPALQVPLELKEASAKHPAVKAIVEGQQQLFEVRRIEMRGQLSIIEEQHEQLKNELGGLNAERRAAAQQTGLTAKELKAVEGLYEKGYTTRTRVFSLQREMAQLSGNSGRLAASAARTRSALIENELKLIQARNQLYTVVQGELRDTQAKIPTLREQYNAAKRAFDAMTIRAPSAGTVMASRVNTLGSVVRPGDTILEIVPAGDRLMVEVQLRPGDVDSVKIGLETQITLTGLSQRTSEQLTGRVTHVSADALQDTRSSATYFVAHVDVPLSQIERLKGVQLQPGMPAAVMIKTGDRTALAYLTQPLTDSINRAWREQ
ncbi:MAG: HlyD family type I secretion periplasmic adaptor subunit [Alphaproteobacteria bacterium]|nr:HlyD family type I secretion periplasmic adaptor subunit [Alphaproteobacteria bacterium]